MAPITFQASELGSKIDLDIFGEEMVCEFEKNPDIVVGFIGEGWDGYEFIGFTNEDLNGFHGSGSSLPVRFQGTKANKIAYLINEQTRRFEEGIYEILVKVSEDGGVGIDPSELASDIIRIPGLYEQRINPQNLVVRVFPVQGDAPAF